MENNWRKHKKVPWFMLAVTLILLDTIFYCAIINKNFRDAYTTTVHTLVKKITNRPDCKNCNIILISIDTLGANHLPCYGYGKNTAPNLCAFAKDNILVNDMNANSTYTLPSHVSIFTGLYPASHNVNIPSVDALDPSVPFFPELLQKNGYEVFFCMSKNDPHLPLDKVYYRGINEVFNVNEPEDWEKCLARLKENNERGKKTFLFLHTYRVHSPFLLRDNPDNPFNPSRESYPPIPNTKTELNNLKYTDSFFAYFKEYFEKNVNELFWGSTPLQAARAKKLQQLMSLKTKQERVQFVESEENKNLVQEYLGSYYVYLLSATINPATDTNKIQHVKTLYDSLIWSIDQYLEKTFCFLKESRLWDNTVITITSDHGEEFMEYDNVIGHGNNVYDPLVKVPLIIRVPGTYKRVVTKQAESVDIFPTIFNIVDIDGQPSVSGIDLFGSKTKSYVRSDLLYYDNMTAIRDGVWKLIVKWPDVPTELYNTETDPEEHENLIFTNNEIKNRLFKYFIRGNR